MAPVCYPFAVGLLSGSPRGGGVGETAVIMQVFVVGPEGLEPRNAVARTRPESVCMTNHSYNGLSVRQVFCLNSRLNRNQLLATYP